MHISSQVSRWSYLREPQSEEQAVPVEQPLRDPPTDGTEQSRLQDSEPRHSVPFAAGRTGHPLRPFLGAGQDLQEDQIVTVVAQGKWHVTNRAERLQVLIASQKLDASVYSNC